MLKMEPFDDFIDLGKEEMVCPEGEVKLKSEVTGNTYLTMDPLALEEVKN